MIRAIFLSARLMLPVLFLVLATWLSSNYAMAVVLPQGSPQEQALTTAASRYERVDLSFSFDNPSFGSLPNGVTFARDMVTSHAGWQYLGYWNQNRHLALARRQLPNGAWETLEFTDYTNTTQDAHNAVSIGVCTNDGTLHLAFDHHNDDLNYRRSIPGLANQPLAFAWDMTSFGPIKDYLNPVYGTISVLTYPRFIRTPSGNLQFSYREFPSGNGRLRLVDYDGFSGSWSSDRVFIERTGDHTDPLGGFSSSRNPYPNRIAYDIYGTLHITWTWREKAPIVYNHDIAYAYSEDGGFTWFNNHHQLVADTATGTAITNDTPNINVVSLGAEWGLMNDQGHVVDDAGRVHVVMYHKDQPDTEVSYGNSGNSHYNHYWREADGTWHSYRLETIGNRPKLFLDPHQRLILTYQSGTVFAADMASPYRAYQDWTTFYSYPGGFGSSAQGDEAWYRQSGVLSMAWQERPNVPGESTWLGIVDFAPKKFAPTLEVDQERKMMSTLKTERDTYVRNGSFTNESYGSESSLRVQHSTNPDNEHLAFLRYHVDPLRGLGVIKYAELRLDISQAGAQWVGTDIRASRCNLDTWPEYTTNWNNRPLPTGPFTDGTESGGVVRIDVTDAIATEMRNGGARITFELSGSSTDPQSWVELKSRETGSTTTPRLWIEQENFIECEADTYVRSGVYAGDNFGSDDRLLVKESDNTDFNRISFLRFNLTGLAGTGEIDRVYLEMSSPVMGSLGQTTPYRAHFVDDDSWNENTLTWNSQPTPGTQLTTHFGRPAMRWDVTSAAIAEASGDGRLSLAIRSQREGSERIVHLWSREAADEQLRPRLIVRYR